MTRVLLLDAMRKVISTHTPLTGRDFIEYLFGMAICISTHTPLTGRDGGSFSDERTWY